MYTGEYTLYLQCDYGTHCEGELHQIKEKTVSAAFYVAGQKGWLFADKEHAKCICCVKHDRNAT